MRTGFCGSGVIEGDLSTWRAGSQNPDMKVTLTKEQVHSDAFQMVGVLEEVHPMFLKKQATTYMKMKEQYLLAAQKAMTVSDFRILTSRFLASLNDGHTRLTWTDTATLDVNWKWINSALVIGPGCNLPENAQVISIGGMPVSKITSVIDTLFPVENDAANVANRENYIKDKFILEAAGVFANSNSMNISINLNGTVSEKMFPLIIYRAAILVISLMLRAGKKTEYILLHYVLVV